MGYLIIGLVVLYWLHQLFIGIGEMIKFLFKTLANMFTILFRYGKKIFLKEQVRFSANIFDKLRIATYLCASIGLLIILKDEFWIALITLILVWLILYLVDRLIYSLFGCRVCLSKGRLTGYNDHLGAKFDNHECYACNGERLVFNDSSQWYGIIIKTNKELRKLKRKQANITKQLRQFSSEVVIGDNVTSRKVINNNRQSRDEFMMYAKNAEASIKLHQEIEKKAHICLHVFHLSRQHRKWRKKLNALDEQSFEIHEMALVMGHEAELAFSYGPDTEVFEDLLELGNSPEVTRELKLDIERATQNLKKLFKENNG
jgi:hypothetical protein